MSSGSLPAPASPPAPIVSVDMVLFTLAPAETGRHRLEVLLVRRERAPHANSWALPGSRIRPDESLEDAAQRVLQRVAGATDIYLEQLYTFGTPNRDPRGRVITVAYYALVRGDQVHTPPEREDGLPQPTTAWFPADAPPPLAFDHSQILDYARWRLRNKIEYSDVAFQFLPERFTLTHLRQVYEAVLDEELDKRNFNRKVLGSGQVVPTGALQSGRAHRPAQLYSFVRRSTNEGATVVPERPG